MQHRCFLIRVALSVHTISCHCVWSWKFKSWVPKARFLKSEHTSLWSWLTLPGSIFFWFQVYCLSKLLIYKEKLQFRHFYCINSEPNDSLLVLYCRNMEAHVMLVHHLHYILKIFLVVTRMVGLPHKQKKIFWSFFHSKVYQMCHAALKMKKGYVSDSISWAASVSSYLLHYKLLLMQLLIIFFLIRLGQFFLFFLCA